MKFKWNLSDEMPSDAMARSDFHREQEWSDQLGRLLQWSKYEMMVSWTRGNANIFDSTN